ncbi:hypothetical protein L484_008514 [Morus notabilis]|uniref:Uncharacterized protein n=2 Tax=Morus notabilis TaxID=981085 RepID=W9S002_9ROSA|nr:hypothetical protein L484_008514 [Morus notabilis]
MAITVKSLIAIVIMSCLINKGLSGNNCSLDDINIGTVRTGREIKEKPEWNVTVINNCGCAQKAIELSCKGFQTAEPLDPSTLLQSKQGDTCLLINGSSLEGFDSVRFSYAWDPPFLLLPVDSLISC